MAVKTRFSFNSPMVTALLFGLLIFWGLKLMASKSFVVVVWSPECNVRSHIQKAQPVVLSWPLGRGLLWHCHDLYSRSLDGRPNAVLLCLEASKWYFNQCFKLTSTSVENSGVKSSNGSNERDGTYWSL